MRLLMFFFLAVLLVTGCQSEGGDSKMLPSGFSYVVHKDEPGQTAQPGERAYFHYNLRIDDSLATTSFTEPIPVSIEIPDTSTLGRELQPLEEALMLMSVGDSLTFSMPMDSIPNAPADFEGAENLNYDLVLVETKTKEQLQSEVDDIGAFVRETIDQYNAGELDDLQETESGFKYVIHEAGTGPTPDSTDIVLANYYGALVEDGTMFDNSFQRGAPFNFPLKMGQVIQGWDEGFSYLKEGAKATFFIPAPLGYGAQGSPPVIPGGAELVFYVELVGVIDNPNMPSM